jgi:hypothetical protein
MAKRYFDKGEGWDTVADMLVIVESIMRDVMALQHGADKILNAGLREIPLRHASPRKIEEMAHLITAIRRGVNENINMKIAATELFFLISQLGTV